jgi:hypothetical protein
VGAIVLYIGAVIRNPWSRRHRTISVRDINLTKNKSIELGLYQDNSILGFGFGITAGKRDHPGFNFDVNILGYTVDFQFYDHRHYHQD